MKNYLFLLFLLSLACSKQQTDLKQKTPVSNQQIPFCDIREMPGKKIMAQSITGGKIFFLDFDGHTVENTVWNVSGPIVCAASGLTAQQQSDILNQTAQDYSAFDVVVTTDSLVYLSADPNRRMRCVFTTSYQWYGMAGGVAFIGSFMWGDNTPCFVFSGLLNYSTKKNQDAASHELGHTVGLYHQASYNSSCVMTSQYNYGQGIGEVGWAPIMGVAYNQNMNTFFNGPNSYGCRNYQDDINILNAIIPLKSDDFPNSFDAAWLIKSDIHIDGIIESKRDVDVFGFHPFFKGPHTIELQSFNNIDGRVEIYSNSWALLLTIDPPESIHIPITLLPSSARYFKISASSNSPNVKQDVQLGRYTLKIMKIQK